MGVADSRERPCEKAAFELPRNIAQDLFEIDGIAEEVLHPLFLSFMPPYLLYRIERLQAVVPLSALLGVSDEVQRWS